jgi:hypothetical protein
VHESRLLVSGVSECMSAGLLVSDMSECMSAGLLVSDMSECMSAGYWWVMTRNEKSSC